jgi:hypothetical protein
MSNEIPDYEIPNLYDYIEILNNLAKYIIDNGILYDEHDNELLKTFIKNLSVEINSDYKITHFDIYYIPGTMAAMPIKKIYINYFKKYILPKFIKNKLDMVIFESDIINIHTNIDSIYGDELDTHTNIIKTKKYGQMNLRDFIREIIRLRIVGLSDRGMVDIEENITIKNTCVIDTDKRLYKDIKNLIYRYIKYKEITILFYFK